MTASKHDNIEVMTKPTDFNVEKTVQAINYFLDLEPDKTSSKMKLLKLLWIADRYAIRNFGYSITQDDYYAMEHGPVGTVTLDILNKNETNQYIDEYIDIKSKKDIASKKVPDFEEFSETDMIALQIVHSVFGKMTAGQLRDFTHKFPEWKRFEKRISENGGRYKMHLDDFFEEPETRLIRTIFTEDESVLKLNKQVFEEDKKLSAVFG